MPLNPPKIESLSVCSKTVVISQQLPGATIDLYQETTLIKSYQAKAVYEVFDLPPGFTLNPEGRIRAIQSLNGESSPTSIPSIVQRIGSKPSKPQPSSIIYWCAHYIALTGMSPGTEVEIWLQNTIIGSAIAHDGSAIVPLSQGVPNNHQLEARAIVCGQPPISTILPSSIALPFISTGRIPAPWFGTPAMDCIEWIRIDGVYPGANVVLKRGDGSWQSWGFGAASAVIHLDKPLKAGEQVSLRQEFGECELIPDEKITRVNSLSLDKPYISNSWCTGYLEVGNLQPGATVLFFDENGNEIGKSGATNTWTDFTIYQPHSGKIGARQALCGKVSSDSNLVDSSVECQVPNPIVIGPLYECQSTVHLTGLASPGGEIELWSDQRGRIGYEFSREKETRLKVAPSLIAGETIQARSITCDGKEAYSGKEPVQNLGDLPMPQIYSIFDGDTVVKLHNIIPDSIINIFVNNNFVNSLQATDSIVDVSMTKMLTQGVTVKITAHLCGQTRETYTIVQQRPSTGNPPPLPGYGKVEIYNCHSEHHNLEIWIIDNIDNTWSHLASITPQYNAQGTCPAQGSPYEINLKDNYAYEIVLVDVEGNNCGINDPTTLACRKQTVNVLGKQGASALPVVVA